MTQTDLDIITLPTEIDRAKLDSRYRLIVMAAQRARMLSQGLAKPLGETRATKPTTVAIQEAIGGGLSYLTGEEARVASEQARLMEVRRAQEEAKRREEMGVELSELEKDLKIYLHEKETDHKQELDALFGGDGPETAPVQPVKEEPTASEQQE